MGQYYKPIILRPKQDGKQDEVEFWWYSHDFKYKLSSGVEVGSGLKLMEHSWINNKFVGEVECFLINRPERLVWAGDYADEEPDGETLYSKCDDKHKLSPTNGLDLSVLKNIFVVNHDKKEFYKRPSKLYHYETDENGRRRREYDWVVNPLPILTCEGNGRGGGDYHGEGELVGSWARDHIEYSQEKPGEDYIEIYPGFKEDW